MVKPILLLLFTILLSSCYRDSTISIVGKGLKDPDIQIRMDGYYYYRYPEGHFNAGITNVWVFYENGVLKDVMSTRTYNLSEIDKEIKDNYIGPEYESVKWSWGVFVLKGKTLEIEKWAVPLFPGPTRSIEYSGTVLNEKQFLLTEYRDPDTGKREKVNMTYTFREFSPKPDSTNQFIEGLE